jgi:hypothetical protein
VRIATFTILFVGLGTQIFGQPPCGVAGKPGKHNGSDMVLIDLDPDFVQEAGITSDPEKLAAGGRTVTGVTSTGATVVLLRFLANFPGEQFEITLVNDRKEVSTSTNEDGALAKVPDNQNRPLPVESLHFNTGSIVVTAVKTKKGAMTFAFYRAPTNFARGPSDYGKASRVTSFEVRSLGRPCGPSAH